MADWPAIISMILASASATKAFASASGHFGLGLKFLAQPQNSVSYIYRTRWPYIIL